jgi:chromosome segregation ATPase
MGAVEPQSDVVSELGQLRLAIDREAAATRLTLTHDRSASEDERLQWGVTEYRELRRQLSALPEHVSRAESRDQDPEWLRAELATLLSFARTLRSDAERWCAARHEAFVELERQEAAARQERERLAAERAELVQRRDALQLGIEETANRLAQANEGDCRYTIPIFTLGEGLTVCSVTVSGPGGRFRWPRRWLVTLDGSREGVLVARD